jgi:hypothetical protein
MVFSQNFRQAIPVDLCPADDGFPHANFGRKVIKKTRGNRMGWVDSMGFNGIWWDMNGKGDLVGWLWDDYGMIMRYVAECIHFPSNTCILHPPQHIATIPLQCPGERSFQPHRSRQPHMGLRLCVRLMESPKLVGFSFWVSNFQWSLVPKFHHVSYQHEVNPKWQI